MNAKIEKKATKMMKKEIKKEKENHPFYGMHQVLIAMLNFNSLTWANLP